MVDDDGNFSVAHLTVNILNQRPVALFERPLDGQIGDTYIFSSSSFDPEGIPQNYPIHGHSQTEKTR
ncbi:MAG: hypothetical protein Ct9H90mP26_2550 [Methanobacteriota archaeon]|nr:MAG: hypothetical protein Ct9H90mP26_2550 [Euryarchaeota archaeon]